MLSLGYLYFVIFFCLIRLDIKVSTPTRTINIRTMTISLLSLPKVGVRSRLEPVSYTHLIFTGNSNDDTIVGKNSQVTFD